VILAYRQAEEMKSNIAEADIAFTSLGVVTADPASGERYAQVG